MTTERFERLTDDAGILDRADAAREAHQAAHEARRADAAHRAALALYLYPEECAAIVDAALRLERASNAARVRGTSGDVDTRVAWDRFNFTVKNVTERATEAATEAATR